MPFKARFVWAAGLLLAGSAAAETSPYSIGLAQAVVHDSNLLRLSSDQTAPAGLSKSDTQSTTTLFAGLDQPFGRQRVYGNAALREQRLAHNDLYDNQGYSVLGGLDWSTIERLSGTVSLGSSRSLAGLNTDEIGLLQRKNLETSNQFDSVVRLGLVGRYSAEAGYSLRSLSYSAPETTAREFRQKAGSIGLRYRPSSASTFGAALRLTQGRYPHYQLLADGSYEGDRFKRRDLDLSASLAPSGVSSFEVRLSLSRTRYDLNTQRDFAGLTGAGSWSWRPTGKLLFTTTLSRDAGQDTTVVDSGTAPDSGQSGGARKSIEFSRLTTTLGLRVGYELSAKVSAGGSFAVARRSLARTLSGSTDGGVSDGGDRTDSLGLNVTWRAARSLRLGCEITAEERRSSSPLSTDYSGSTFGCFGQITLQ
jgi:hypothetical protein